MNDKDLKLKSKQQMLQKLKKLCIKSQTPNQPFKTAAVPQLVRAPLPTPTSLIQQNQKIEPRVLASSINTKRLEADDQNDEKQNKMNQQQNIQDTNNRQPKKSVRAKKPYYEHYKKQGVFQPILQYVRNHPNPSGRPPNIPEQLTRGIQVVPKRPWVFFGPQNIPPSDCQEINQKTFSVIFEQAKKMKGTGAFKKSNKKKGHRRNQDQISQISDEMTSNFTFSDSVDMSKQSDLISQFRTQTKALKNNYDSSGNAQSSYYDDQFSSISGSITQRQRYNLFDSSQSQDEKQQSRQAIKAKKKFRKILESSDSEPQRSSGNRPSPFQNSSAGHNNTGSSGNVQNNSDKGSSVKVQVDQAESSISKSKSRGNLRSSQKTKQKQKVKQKSPQRKNPLRSTRLKKVKKQQDSD